MLRFHSKAGQEVRTWVLFILGIGLVIFFAGDKNELNPWWTIIIGVFTSSTILVSAVKTLMGGIEDGAKRASDKSTGGPDHNGRPEEPNEATFSSILGNNVFAFVRPFRRRHYVPVQSS